MGLWPAWFYAEGDAVLSCSSTYLWCTVIDDFMIFFAFGEQG